MNDEEIKELIKRKRRQIILHSFGYYRLNENIIDDHTFDKWCMELVKLHEQYPELSKQVEYSFGFELFDGSSGYGLPLGETWLPSTWQQMKKAHKEYLTNKN